MRFLYSVARWSEAVSPLAMDVQFSSALYPDPARSDPSGFPRTVRSSREFISLLCLCHRLRKEYGPIAPLRALGRPAHSFPRFVLDF